MRISMPILGLNLGLDGIKDGVTAMAQIGTEERHHTVVKALLTFCYLTKCFMEPLIRQIRLL